jgi:hypothetical protein
MRTVVWELLSPLDISGPHYPDFVNDAAITLSALPTITRRYNRELPLCSPVTLDLRHTIKPLAVF